MLNTKEQILQRHGSYVPWVKTWNVFPDKLVQWQRHPKCLSQASVLKNKIIAVSEFLISYIVYNENCLSKIYKNGFNTNCQTLRIYQVYYRKKGIHYE